MKRKVIYFSVSFLLLSMVVIFICNYQINKFSEGFLYQDLNKVPYNKVGLILGTARFLSNGVSNPYFENRIIAATQLYYAGKIKYMVISGDNSHMSYNEPRDMKKELLKRAIPDSCIFLDYAGFRTYDSVIRCKEIFGQKRFTIISQQFHNERAIYIARHHDMEAIGYDAVDVNSLKGLKTNSRELLARVKVFIDIFVTHKQPRFLGEKILIP